MAVKNREHKSSLVSNLLNGKSRKRRNRRARQTVGQQFESLENRYLLATFVPSKDTSLFESTTGNLANGSGPGIYAGRTAQAETLDLRRGLLAFDLTSIPAGSVVTDVRLDLAVTRDPAGATPAHNFSLHRATSDWGEGTSIAPGAGGRGVAPATNDATWLHSFFDATNWTTAGGDFDATASATTAVGDNGTTASWTSAELVADVQSWVDNPASNLGWFLIGDETAARTARRFASRETTGGNGPVLDVTFTAATPTVSITSSTPTVPELDGEATFTIGLSGSVTEDVTVELGFAEGTATLGDDFTASATQVVIPAGDTQASITISTEDDLLDEPDETIIVDILTVSAGAQEDGVQQATTTITDDDEPAGNTVTLAIDPATIAEAGGVATITATLSSAATQDIQVDLAYSGDAISTVDYNAAGTQITIATGATSGSLAITAVDDAVDEADETIVVDIANVSAGAAEDGQQQVVTTITDDDDPVVSLVTLSIDNTALAENGGTATVTATLSAAATADVIVDLGFTGDATSTVDYNSAATQIVVATGATTGSLAITAVDDAIDEPDETIVIDIVAVTGGAEDGTQQVVATITDDDEPVLPTVSLAIDSATIAEAAGVATLTATLSGTSTADITVDLGFTGTATNPDDYTAAATQITIAAGATSGTLAITAVDDATDEPDETVIVDITAVSAGATEDGDQQVTATITDDDAPAAGNGFGLPQDLTAAANETISVPIGISTVELTQAAGNRLAGVGVALRYDPNALTINGVTNGSFITGNAGWSLVPNTSVVGQVVLVGFTSTPVGGVINDVLANLEFTVNANAPAGPTVINLVPANGAAFTELLDENDRNLTFASPVTDDPTDPSDGIITIAGDTTPTVTLAVDNTDIAEAGGVATLTATLSGAATADVTVDLGFSGTATNPDDYTTAGTQITIATGATSGSLVYTAVDDALDEENETIIVDIIGATGANEDGDQQVTTTITDDDDPLPTVTLSIDNDQLAEASGTANIIATLSAVSTADITVDLSFSGTAGTVDYTTSATQIVIPAGVSSAAEAITASQDSFDEPDETVIIDIAAVSAGALEDGDQQVTATIIDDDDPVLPTVTLAVDNTEIAEAGGVAILLATISSAATADVTIDLGFSGTATNPDDYTTSGTQITIITGATSGSLVYTAVDDALDEENETIIVDVIGATGATEDGDQQVTTTIIDDDDPVLPTVTLAVDNTEIAEAGGMALYTVTLSAAATADITVDLGFTGTATNPDDYTAAGTQITIATGATAGTLAITAVDDALDEENETIVVDILAAVGATEDGDQQVTTTIIDDDDPVLPTLTLAVDSTDIAEAGGMALFTVTLSAAATADVTVDLGFTGTATNPDDYTAAGTQITIATGATSGTLAITAVDDALDEENETIVVDILAAVGATEDGDQQVTATIIDDDDPVLPTVTLAVDSTDIAEAGGVATLTATLSAAATADVTVDLGFTGTATNPDDYTAAGTQITIATGATSGTLAITAVDDALDEENETIVVDILAAVGATEDGDQQVTATIIDDDDPVLPTVTLAVDSTDIAEAGGVATLTATLSAAATADVTVDLGFTGTATNPDDYAAAGTQITIATGATSGTLAITAVDDALDEENETIVVDILAAVGATEDGDQQVTATIIDDDDPVLPTVTLAVDSTDIAEAGGVATLTATLSAAATADVTVDLGFTGTATNPDDYTAAGTQITIATGATSGTLAITAVDDALDEENETIVVDILAAVGATEDGDQQVTATIIDDDDPVLPTVTLAVDSTDIAEAGGVATLTATLSAAATADVTVDLGFTGTATNPDDYTAAGTQITIATGATSGTLAITAVDDALDEENETIIVDILAAVGATEDGDQQVTTTITDDDDPVLPTVTLAIDNADIAEAAGTANVTATLSAAATVDISVDLAFGGTATNGDDYTASATQVVIAAGSTSGSVAITAVQDAVDEPNETVVIDVAAVSAGAEEDGDQQVTATIVDDDAANEPPVLTDPGPQTVSTTQDSFDITLEATDPNTADVLTFSATLESAEYLLDSTIGLNFTGDLFTDFGGLGEKWLLADDETTWYYITPDGTFYEWLGGGVLNRTEVAQLSVATFDDPALLYDAQPGATVPATATVTGNTLNVNPNDGFVGSFAVNVSVSDGALTDSQLVLVTVTENEPPVLTNPGNQTLPTSQDTLDVALEATDPTGEAITFTATAESGEYYLDQTIGLQLGPNGLEPNWSGTEDERWVLNDEGTTWYFITPDGGFWEWLGGNREILANANRIATLSPATHADPSLLYDAQPGATVPVTVTVNGSTLTIDPNAGVVGTFGVMITATDAGGLTDSALIQLDVTPAPAGSGAVQVPANLAVSGRPADAGILETGPTDAPGEATLTESVGAWVEEQQPVVQPVDSALDRVLQEGGLDDELVNQLVEDLLASE